MNPHRELTLLVPQGIGDIYWIYQQVISHVDWLHLKVAVIAGHDNATKQVNRAAPWVLQWPGIGSVSQQVVTHGEYDHLAQSRFSLDEVIDDLGAGPKNRQTPIPFACNGWLESGQRLETMSARPDRQPRWSVDFRITKTSNPALLAETGQPILAVYISGSPGPGAWQNSQWIALYHAFCEQYHARDWLVAFIGAAYDLPHMQRFAHHAQVRRSTWVIDRDPDEVLDVLQRSRFFLCYQSGLGIMADALKVPQLMLYYPRIEAMMNTWCQPGHYPRGIYNSATFDQDPAEVIADLAWSAPDKP